MIVITGQIFTGPDTLPALYARLKALCEPSRAEDGCIFYHMAMEDAERGVIMAMEGWRDQAALDAHLALPATARATVSANHAMGRMGDPDEIAAGIVYLSTPAASFMTGSELVIDGGMTAK